ncbi:MAG: error-prone DNA polymerase [Anaerolineae bacterium]|nr:MAG: error-prone DNA polymerase [Anaerolineae bacterium]
MPERYAELHCHSYYSLLDGASSPEALVEHAAALGYPALALTDHNGLYGAVRFWQAARQRGIKPVIGAEVTLDDACPARPERSRRKSQLTLLAKNQQGYANLCRLISAGQLSGQKGQPQLTLEVIERHSDGLLCLSGCRRGAVASALLAKDEAKARQAAGRLREVFGPDRFWIELQRHGLPTNMRLNEALVALAERLGVGVVATNNVHYAERAGQRLHDVLTCIRHHMTLPEALAGGLLHPNSERFLKSPQEMATLFADLPQALRNTLAIAERCDVSLDFSAQRLPDFPVPQGHTPASTLQALCEAALPCKFDPITPRASAQLAHELAVIERTGLAGYFLVVWDIVRFARARGIRCQGRGSAANSLVAYLLGITPVDPLRHNLLFERFLSEDSHSMPDIDVDLAGDRREEVIQYVYERYGEAHVGMVCNVVTYRARSALRDVAKALAFPPDVIDRAAKSLDTRSATEAAESIEPLLPNPPSTNSQSTLSQLPWHLLADLLKQIAGVPRHLSIHVGGMVVTAAPLVEVVPLERATMPGRVVVQWDKDSVEEAGLIKIDLLGLRTLGVIEEALAHIREQQGVVLDLDTLPLDDPAIYATLQRADTVGCFQVESRPQMMMQSKMQPRSFEDIVVEVALVRPGPIQGDMVHPYLRRRQGLEPVSYPHPALEPVLAETLGVIVFQEQIIRVAVAIAGFSPAEADRLRRAISRRRSEVEMAALRERFLAGAQANGVDEATAAKVFCQLSAFSGFGFCKSHAAAFALVAYQTLYLKTCFPAAFYCAILNHQPMGFYPVEVVINDAQRHGVPILHPDVDRSGAACTLESGGSSTAIRLGLSYVHGLGEAWQTRIVDRRENHPFRGLGDFCRRTRLPRPVVENLIRAGAMDGFGQARRDLLWELGGLRYQEEGLDVKEPIESVALPILSKAERLGWEYELLGMTPGDHVMALYRKALRGRGVLSTGELAAQRDGGMVRVAGRVVVRQQPPTAKGVVFITLEDEEGLLNLIVRPDVYERYRDALRNAPLLLVEGRLQQEGQTFSVLVQGAAALG